MSHCAAVFSFTSIRIQISTSLPHRYQIGRAFQLSTLNCKLLVVARTPSISVVALAGFMGSGKTTVGAQLARQLAWRFIDLDERIEDASGLRITEFFERHGEPY